MNCRPGDLARIVGTHPALGLNDRIVKLADAPAFLDYGIWHWRLEEELTTTVRSTGFNMLTGHVWFPGDIGYIAEVPDENLRRIDNPGDSAVDEMVERLGAAPPTLTEVMQWSAA